jgi:hypothetical protein
MRMLVNKSMYYGLPLTPIPSLKEKDDEMALRGMSRDARVLPGPILGDGHHRVTYQSHTITIVTYTAPAESSRPHTARVMHMRHGGGEEVFEIYPCDMSKILLEIILPLDDVSVYCFFYQLWSASTRSYNAGREWEHTLMIQAAAEGRLKVNKVRNRDAYRVKVLPASTSPALIST